MAFSTSASTLSAKPPIPIEVDGAEGGELRRGQKTAGLVEHDTLTRMVPWAMSRRRVRKRSSPASISSSFSSTMRPTGTSSMTSVVARRQPDHVAVSDVHRLVDAERPGEGRMLMQVTRLAMDGDCDLGLDPAIHLLDLVPARDGR